MMWRRDDLLMTLLQAPDAQACQDVFLAAMADTGLDHGMVISSNSRAESLGCFTYYSNHSPQFLSDYNAEGGLLSDCTLWMAIAHSHRALSEGRASPLMDWRSTDAFAQQNQHRLPDAFSAIEQVAADHGVMMGFSYVFANSPSPLGGSNWGIGLSATGLSEQVFERDILPLQQKIHEAVLMLEAALQRHRPDSMPQWQIQALSQREQDIMRWLAEGLRISDIALNRLGVSEATINKDLRRLKDRLNIRTLEELTVFGFCRGLCL